LPKLPAISAKAAIKALDQFEFKLYHQIESHTHLWNEGKNFIVSVPNHPELPKVILT
jgi:predicted RNA binding protein YcfA (HicA-like mRNA interferase family)